MGYEFWCCEVKEDYLDKRINLWLKWFPEVNVNEPDVVIFAYEVVLVCMWFEVYVKTQAQDCLFGLWMV